VSENVTVNILNCTFSGNRNGGNGGTIYLYGAQASNHINIVNTTVVDNIGRSGGGSGAGINVEVQSSEERKPVVRILNSIVEGNAIGDGVTAEDLVYGYEPSVDKLTVSNSFIGKVYVTGAMTVPADCYTETLYWDYMTRVFDRSEIQSGIDALDGGRYVYPLTAGATALNHGNAAFLREFDIATDQLGTPRPFTDGKCSVGAMEGVGMPETGLRKLPLGGPVAIYVAANGVLQIDAPDAQPVKAELFTLGGQRVASGTGIGEVQLPAGGGKGLYIVKVVLPNGTVAQKVFFP
jgi:hypothetical protein